MGTAQSQQIRPGLFLNAKRDSASTGLIRVTNFNLDTLNYGLRNYIKYWGKDSVQTASKDYEQFPGTFNSLNNANDSVNVALYGGVYHIHPTLWAQYLDRVSVNTDLPGVIIPATWRTDLPPISTDSSFIFRISRLAARPANARIWLTAYKVKAGTGLSFANTVGVFYDAIAMDEAQFKAATTGNTQGHIQFSNKRIR